MRRRDFIKVIAGSATIWPLTAFAQQSERMRRIGVLTGADADDLDMHARIEAFEDGLKQLGWTNGQNVRIDIRASLGDGDRLRRYAEELVALAPDDRRIYPASGGLISYGADVIDLSRRAAGYVDRILKGEKPAELPVQAPSKYELVVNLKTAKALGLTIPPAVLTRADEVIE